MNTLHELLKNKPALDLWLKAREPVIGMKIRQQGMTEMQTEFLKTNPGYVIHNPRACEPSISNRPKYFVDVDLAREIEDELPRKLAEWLLNKQRERGMALLVAAGARGEEQGWGRPVIINPARPELVMLPELPPLPDLGMTSPLREYMPWVGKTHVLLDESLRQWFRRPRSKKKRIREKWRKRPENWRPSPLLYAVHVAVGQQAMRFGYGRVSDAPASGSPAGRTFLMHPGTWARLERENPELAATCSVNRRSGLRLGDACGGDSETLNLPVSAAGVSKSPGLLTSSFRASSI